MKGRDKPHKTTKKQPQKTLKERRAAKAAHERERRTSS